MAEQQELDSEKSLRARLAELLASPTRTVSLLCATVSLTAVGAATLTGSVASTTCALAAMALLAVSAVVIAPKRLNSHATGLIVALGALLTVGAVAAAVLVHPRADKAAMEPALNLSGAELSDVVASWSGKLRLVDARTDGTKTADGCTSETIHGLSPMSPAAVTETTTLALGRVLVAGDSVSGTDGTAGVLVVPVQQPGRSGAARTSVTVAATVCQ